MFKNKSIRFFKDLSIKDVPEVGGKNASLGEMYVHLTKYGIRIPNGFATSSTAYREFLEVSGLKKKIREILKGLDTHNIKDLMKRGAEIRKIIIATEFPKEFSKEIITKQFPDSQDGFLKVKKIL